jgi:hypothetical protein
VSIQRLLRQHAQLVNRTQDGPPDIYGDPTWTEETIDLDPSNPSSPGGVHVQPVSSEELATLPDGRIRWRAWLPPTVTPRGTSRLVLASGLEAEIVGPPRTWTDPRTTRAHHIEVDLAEVH